ncbi:MAG TPA: tRNA (5-methylaminomethyl-2-thiouridylate)-methyltransferase [Gammaproteobacteria bacterium]|nr:tRNA (5-methylaminomethyl-2-thiouridylate)-methyltransferase [Gammaproteobacteria bacterium]
MNRQIKAVSLISGGLDSLLATRAVIDQGVHVEGINFYTGFCVEGHTHAIRKRDKQKEKRNNALWVAETLGIKLHIIDVIEEYKDVLINPKHGYGANMNPCHDCKTFMVRKARQWMDQHGFDFIITGEVVGQRPMSQRKDTMPVIALESGAGERLLRPLCAKHLPETLPETEGWVNRDELFNFHGRSRKPQMALAELYGFRDYAQPAGGCCFLTDASYAKKLVDLWESRGNKEYEMDDIMLLKVGRHIRPGSRFKMIIAREEGEVNFMQGYCNRFISIRTTSHSGPLALLDGQPVEEDIKLAARITARYSKGRAAEQVEVECRKPDGETQTLQVKPIAVAEIPASWYV